MLRKFTAENCFELEEFLSQPHLTDINNSEQEYMKRYKMTRMPARRGFTGFAWQSLRKNWSGFINYAGPHPYVLISKFEGKPLVIREFPQYQYQNEEIKIGDKIFPHYDGLRTTLFVLPSGDFWGRTDSMEFIERTALNTVDFYGYLKEVNNFEKLKSMVESIGQTYAVSGILYGPEMSSVELPLYRQEDKYDFKITHILNLKTHKYLTHDETKDIVNSFDNGSFLMEECLIDSDIVKETGGYLIHRINDGELEYFAVRNENVEINVRRQIVLEIWETT